MQQIFGDYLKCKHEQTKWDKECMRFGPQTIRGYVLVPKSEGYNTHEAQTIGLGDAAK